jgi:hypothetical protein
VDPVCVAFKAHLGWVNAVAVLARRSRPTPVHAERIDLFSADDREAVEPYHVAGGWHGLDQGPRPENPEAVIRRGRAKQAAAAVERLARLKGDLDAAGLDWQRAVVLTARGWLGDLEHILGSHAHIHVAEGEAIRDATRAALADLQILSTDQDEKSIAELAGKRLRVDDCDAMMKELRPVGIRSWRKEERSIALGAWLHRR